METQDKLLEKILSCGLETKEDLGYVKEEDMSDLLRPIQCRKLLDAFQLDSTRSFADVLHGGQLIGGGYSSLLLQLKVHIEHLNRNNTLVRRRMQKSTGDRPTRRPTDSYGCTRWQPEFPPGESDETLEDKRKRLEEIFLHEGVAGAERAEVSGLMEATYCLQRRTINATPSPTIEVIQNKWPYLFVQKFLYAHFELLTDTNIHRMLELSMEECGKAIIQFFRSKPTNEEVRAVLAMGEDREVASYVTQLLLAHFKEKDGLILQADVSATAADVQRTLTLLQSPRMIVLGETLSKGCWMVSIEG
ncbi:hypothetical protein SKAU_G00410560 [Synaphobranchus kaupii]|uniref:Uncharacterized protein n=1 Tax=Synaphobranchus kaupii TaxID=118154 RepID=A0A9Q1IBM4_SYNKA|nr:hypothetical protein SKAU_G00410560 [Synaphobranchus kaupii]